MRYVMAFGIAALIFGVLDALWLSWAGPNLYKPVIGELMADSFNIAPAIAFYLIYLTGMTYFAIRPGLKDNSPRTALINGALLGALCYATFDLTSQAVFQVWAAHISLADIAWGAFATGTTSFIACAAVCKLVRE